MQTKEKEFNRVEVPVDRGTRAPRRARVVAIVAGLVAGGAVAIGAFGGDGVAEKPSPKSTESVIPFVLTEPPAPAGGGGVDG